MLFHEVCSQLGIVKAEASIHSKTDRRLLLIRRALPDDGIEGDPQLRARIKADYVRLARNLWVHLETWSDETRLVCS